MQPTPSKFNREEWIKKITATGMKEMTAKLISEAICEASINAFTAPQVDQIVPATKEDVALAKLELLERIHALDLKFEQTKLDFKERMHFLDLKIEETKNDLSLKIEENKNDLSEKIYNIDLKIEETKGSLNLKIEEVRSDLVKYINSSMWKTIAILSTVIGIAIAASSLIQHLHS